MYAPLKQLKPLSGVTLTADDEKILKWLRSAIWEAQKDVREPIPYKAKVPEFYAGVRLYHMQAGSGGAASTRNPLDLFIKKIEYQGVIGKQEMYPVTAQGAARYLSLKKDELDNLGIGQEDEE